MAEKRKGPEVLKREEEKRVEHSLYEKICRRV